MVPVDGVTLFARIKIGSFASSPEWEARMHPFDLTGLKTYDLQSRPSKVFIDDLGQPADPRTPIGDFIDTLPKQLAANELRRLRDHLCRCYDEGRTVAVALGGHVIKT